MSTAFTLDLTKSFELALEKVSIDLDNIPEMAVKVALDRSGSMSTLYPRWVQNALDKFIIAAMKFDDDGALQVGFFNNEMEITREATEEDVGSYINNVNVRPYGGTSFFPILKEFVGNTEGSKQGEKQGFFSKLLGKGKKSAPEKNDSPRYITIITDGDNNDVVITKNFIANELSKYPKTFIQFISIGNGVNKNLLQSYDDLSNQVNWMHVENPSTITNEEFFELIANDEFAEFVKTL
jgi:hypothetical protein